MRGAQDLKDARLFVSDGVAERYSLQFAEQRDENYRDQIESIGIDDLQIVDVDSSGIFDEISVRINSHAMRSRHSLCDGGRIGGSVSVERMVEIWSFLRLRGAVTDRGKPGLIEGNCPDCGAALSMNQAAQCPYCRSLLRNGQFDWVLCEVTRFSQWERTSDESVPGLEQLRERDAGFSRQALEDRALVIFWRRVRADRMGKIDPLRKVASDSFCDGYASTLKRPREYAGDCALGGVKMMRFIAACEGDVMDRIVASIRWSGKVMTVGIDGQRVGCGELFQTNVIVLGRQAGGADGCEPERHFRALSQLRSGGIAERCQCVPCVWSGFEWRAGRLDAVGLAAFFGSGDFVASESGWGGRTGGTRAGVYGGASGMGGEDGGRGRQSRREGAGADWIDSRRMTGAGRGKSIG